MKFYLHSDEKINGIIKDVLLIAFVFILFAFIEVEFAILGAVICTSILLIRRITLDLNPEHGKNKIIIYNGKKLSVPKNIEIFKLEDNSSFELLNKYAEAMRFISMTPATLIIRFPQHLHIDKSSSQILSIVIKQLSDAEIRTIFSDIDIAIYNQLEFHDILNIIGRENIFPNIEEALKGK